MALAWAFDVIGLAIFSPAFCGHLVFVSAMDYGAEFVKFEAISYQFPTPNDIGAPKDDECILSYFIWLVGLR